MAKDQLQFLPDENPNPVLRSDLKGTICYANPACKELLEIWQTEVDSTLPSSAMELVNSAVNSGELVELEVHTAVHTFLLRVVAFVERGYVNIYGFDITPRKHLQRKVEQLENYDALTGLPNRQSFHKSLEASLNSGYPGAVLLIDINDFKMVNIAHGSDIADAVLREVGSRLVECIPSEYGVFRLGSDDFVIIRPQIINDDDAANFAQVVIDNVTQPYLIQNHDVELHVVVGISIFPNDATEAAEVLEHANLAVMRAKVGPNDKFEFFRKYMSSVAIAKRSLLKDLRYAVERDQLKVFYQPQHCLKTRKIVGMEALIRWQHPEHGLLTPNRFTNLAEESGLIVGIGEWILRAAATQTAAWKREGLGDFRIGVNVSAIQFEHEGFVEVVTDVLEKADLPAAALELEIVENVLLQDANKANETLERLNALGVALAIDDFGTGYSSLQYLQHLPIDRIKIDREFIMNIESSERNQAIVDAIMNIANELNIDIIAEGIEREGQLDYLQQKQCEEGQGYYFSEPLSPEDFKTYIRSV